MGTTWLFNVLKELSVRGGVPTAIVADGVPEPDAKWSGSLLIKSHRADSAELASTYEGRIPLYACVMVRDAYPTLRSLVRTQSVDRRELLDWLERDLTSYEETLPRMRNIAVIREAWIKDASLDVIRRLSQFLNLHLREDDLELISERFSRENVRAMVKQLDSQSDWRDDFRQYDKQSQWHAGHIGPDTEPDLELTYVEEARLSAIQARVDNLAEVYPLWDAPEHPDPVGTARAIDYLAARRLQQAPEEPLGAWLRRGLGYLPRGLRTR